MLIAFFYWLTKCSLYRPVILKNPGVYGLVVNFCGFAKFAKRNLFAFIEHHNGVAAVSVLFRICRPSNISWLIPFTRINSVNRVLFCRWSAYIRNEILKRVEPFVAHAYASPPISVIGVGFRVGASGFYGAPNHVLPRSLAFARHAVSYLKVAGILEFLTAPTRNRVPRSQRWSCSSTYKGGVL